MFEQVISTILWALLGLVLMFLGYKIFDWINPIDLDKEIEKGNVAAGVVVAGIFIAIAWIIAAVVV